MPLTYRAARFPSVGRHPRQSLSTSSRRRVMCGASALSCGRWCRMGSGHTGTWQTRMWVCFVSFTREKKEHCLSFSSPIPNALWSPPQFFFSFLTFFLFIIPLWIAWGMEDVSPKPTDHLLHICWIISSVGLRPKMGLMDRVSCVCPPMRASIHSHISDL